MNTRNDRAAQERRRYHRYDASNIAIRLKHGENRSDIKPLNIIDFNRYGLALYSNHSFKVGNTLDFILSDDSGHYVEITGFVCNRAPTSDGFRCGLRFIETVTSDESQTTLFEMEQVLERLAS